MYKTFTYAELEEMDLSKTELAKRMGIECTYDYALPVTWLVDFCERNNLPRNQVTYSTFMVYDKDAPFNGMPESAWKECQQAINKEYKDYYLDKLADSFATEIEQKMIQTFGDTHKGEISELSKGLSDLFQIIYT